MNSTFDKLAFRSGAVAVKENYIKGVKRCMVLVPHPDDESLGCAGLIAELVNQGSLVSIILTTDGSQSHPNSKKYPASRLAALRESELNQALKLLGMAPTALTRYQSTDAAMPGKGEHGFDELASRLSSDMNAFAPDLVLVPYELDPHCDHRATWQLLMTALKNSNPVRPKIWEYPIWLYENASLDDVPVLEPGELLSFDINHHSELKKACIYAHQSQTSTLIDDDPSGFILTPEMIANFTIGKEYFMERKKLNPDATLGRDYFEKLYTDNTDPWEFETSEYEQKKYIATLEAIASGEYEAALEIGCSIGVLTQMLTVKCKQLIAMDISEVALNRARNRFKDNKKVNFILGGVPDDFPAGKYDLIILSEVGYYLSMKDLTKLSKQISGSLTENGLLILVHWTHFVNDYPLTGDQVHEFFAETGMTHLNGNRTADYRLDVYRKST